MDQASYTVDEWCTKHRVCRATFYNLVKSGQAPRYIKIGSRTVISYQADLDWQREHEAGAPASNQ